MDFGEFIIKKYVYMVEFDWSVEDGCDVETELFLTYEKALKRYDEIIANEKTDSMSWVADAIKPTSLIADLLTVLRQFFLFFLIEVIH